VAELKILRVRTLLVACVVLGGSGCKDGCKTPVPFKRGASNAATDASTSQIVTEGTPFEDQTRSITLAQSPVERADGSFRAALDWDLNGDGFADAVVVATDAESRATFETWTKADAERVPEKRTSVSLLSPQAGCILEQAGLTRLAADLIVAKLEVSCAGDAMPPEGEPPAAASAPAPAATNGPAPSMAASGTPPPTATPAPSSPPPPAAASTTGLAAPPPTAAPSPSPPSVSAFDLPPTPGTRARALHQFILTAETTPRVLLHLAALPATDPSDTTSLELAVSSRDEDSDGHGDVLVTANLANDGGDPRSVPLVWLNRPSGFARDRTEPERTLTDLVDAAYAAAAKDPIAGLPAALAVIATHRTLCHESGAARIWVDVSAGLGCGPSVAAGRAAVIRALAVAKQQLLLAALEARAQLDDAAYKVDAADRERVRAAVAAIRGQTNYLWERGPDFIAANGPNVRLPGLGFASEDQLLVRGTIPIAYDVRTRASTPSALAQGVVLGAPGGQVAIVDLVRDCAGRYLRLVPASSIVSGFVASGRGVDVALASERPVAQGCTGGVRRPDRSGWSVLGFTERGVLLAQGPALQLVPITADGKSAGPAKALMPTEPAPPLAAAGALSQNGLRHALATSEGVAIVERGPQPSTTLIRSPASCTGRIGDVAISPSGQRVAMSCSGRVYWAHQTQSQAAAATPPAAAPP
jgi:hypothetical protein